VHRPAARLATKEVAHPSRARARPALQSTPTESTAIDPLVAADQKQDGHVETARIRGTSALRPERQLASGLRDEFEEPVKSELQSAGEGMKEDLQEHAQEAVEETKRTAKGAADRTTEDARDRAEEVRGEAEQAADNVQEQRG